MKSKLNSFEAAAQSAVSVAALRPVTQAALLALGALACFASTAGAAGPDNLAASFVTGRILVMPRAGLSDAALAGILKEHGGGKGRRIGASALYIVDLPAGGEKAAVERLARHAHIKFAEQDRRLPPGFASNDPYFGSQWHLGQIGASAAWNSARGDGVTIAILDTGVDAAHPDLAARIVSGWNIYENNTNTADVHGHGTQVAGAAAAILGNGVGVAGIAGNARIMPIRISDGNGWATFSAMAQGLTWAADHGARVANISYVAAGSAAVNSAANYMKSKGGLVVTGAGNSGTDANIAPTTAMIPVSATDASDARTGWSSFGAFVAMAAPGVGIYTTANGGSYASVSGTSYASPITAGVVGLMMSANPALSAGKIESLLYSSAIDLGAAGRDPYFGHGRVNAAAAVQAAIGSITVADTTLPSASVSAPLGSATVSGLVVVNVQASDNVGVTRVELRSNGALVATDSSAPYAFTWDSLQVANGMATLVATAYDAAGNAGNSANVLVNVANVRVVDSTPPTLIVSQPVNGARVSGNVTINVDATDDMGGAGLRQTLYVDGVLVASATGSVLAYRWNTRKLANGPHSVRAVVQDAAGNMASQDIQVLK